MIKLRSCLWCGKEMKTERASKKICSNSCHARVHDWKETITTSQAYQFLKVEIKHGRHPNPKHSFNSI